MGFLVPLAIGVAGAFGGRALRPGAPKPEPKTVLTAPLASAETEADKAAEEVRKRAAKAGGRSQTILTSPLGVVGAAPVGQKTLLGQ